MRIKSKRELRSLPEKVEYILAHYEETRNNDIELLAHLANEFYDLEPPSNNYEIVATLKLLPSQDEIARARRRVIEKWSGLKYLPTLWEVAKNRKVIKRRWNAYMTMLPKEVKPDGGIFVKDI